MGAIAWCPGGQVIAGHDVRLTLRDHDGRLLGDAVYNFSGAPVLLPVDGETQFVAGFPLGAAWVLPEELNRDINEHAVVVRTENASDGRPVGSGDSATAEVHVPESPSPSTKAARERASLDALIMLSADDRAVVREAMDGFWVPQLSSKTKGTVDPGDPHPFTLSDIYQEHVRLRATYPGVRLLNSSDWGSFSVGGIWVTVAGVPSSQPEAALLWCNRQGLPLYGCLAKRILEYGPSAGSTRLRLGTPTG